MIKYFKKVRLDKILQNKMGDYYKYAIGEIFFVVFGILIALSINNWNEERKSILNEKNIIKNIVEDLKLDSIHILNSLEQVRSQLKVVDEIIAMSLKKVLLRIIIQLVYFGFLLILDLLLRKIILYLLVI